MALTSIGRIALLVREYEEAIDFYVGKLGFELIEDTTLSGDTDVTPKRWVVVAPGRGEGTQVLLARAEGPEQTLAVGKQAGGRVFLFLYTNNFSKDHDNFVAQGIKFRETPRHEPYGTVAVFEDLYGNPWDLIEPRT